VAAAASTFFVSQQLAAAGSGYGSDILVFPGLDETFNLVNDGRVLAEALGRRLTTPRGALPFHPDYGLDVRAWLNEGFTQDAAYRLKAAIERECEADERVASATSSVSFNLAAQSLRFKVSCATATGPFTFVMNVTSLTIELLASE
jgi:phage baseplate assembly protein W